MSDPKHDEAFMREAIELAGRGLGRVEPNPMVGAIVVRNGDVVGRGYHARFGEAHAEVVALSGAGDAARGATLYVTLEPCCHHGKTPPCAEAVIKAGIGRVVAATKDPFPEVAGGGLAKLIAAGIEVDVGLCETEARRQNAAFFKRQETGMPLVIAKWAMTLDGRIATASGDSKWISSEASRRRVHEIRRISDAVIVGAGTASQDAPRLTVRHVEPLEGRGQPTRVVVDDRLVIEPDAEPAASARQVPVIFFTTVKALEDSPNWADALRQAGCEVTGIKHDETGVPLRKVIEELGRRGMSRVLVEGGARLFGSLFERDLADRAMVFVSPRILGGAGALGPVAGPDGKPINEAQRLVDTTVSRLGEDVLIEGRLSDY